MLILNNRLPSKFYSGETPSGEPAQGQTDKPRTVDFSQETEVIKKSDRINVADEAKRTMEIASYKASYGKLEELAKKYVQELNQDTKNMDQAIKVRALADRIGDTILYQCDARSFDAVDSTSGKRWVDIRLVDQYKQLFDLISQSPLASKDQMMTQIGRIKIPEVKGTTSAQEVMAFRLKRGQSDQRREAASFGMIGVAAGLSAVETQKQAAAPVKERDPAAS